jgi:hypothetical protein
MRRAAMQWHKKKVINTKIITIKEKSKQRRAIGGEE